RLGDRPRARGGAGRRPDHRPGTAGRRGPGGAELHGPIPPQGAMTPRMRKLVIGGVLVAAALFMVARSHANDSLLPVGAVAPEVVGKDAAGTTFKLSAQKGHFAVVYFYPKDETTGCIKEACAFRDASGDYAKAGITVFAVSRQDDASHKGFREHYHLPFP